MSSRDGLFNYIHEVLRLSDQDAEKTLAFHVFEDGYQASFSKLESRL
jgi:hypothetical protein